MLLRDSWSMPWPLACGLPQGSVSSSVLFKFYMKPPGDAVWSFEVTSMTMTLNPISPLHLNPRNLLQYYISVRC